MQLVLVKTSRNAYNNDVLSTMLSKSHNMTTVWKIGIYQGLVHVNFSRCP